MAPLDIKNCSISTYPPLTAAMRGVVPFYNNKIKYTI